MEHAGKTLWSALRRVARPEKPLDLLTAVWPVMVGPRLAVHTRPVSWYKGCVKIEVHDPEWHRQLETMGDDIRRHINRWWGTDLVHEVRFLAVKPPKGLSKARPAKKSAQKKHAAPASATPPPAAPSAPQVATTHAENKLHIALKALEPQLSQISDEELRDLITRVASRYLADQDKE